MPHSKEEIKPPEDPNDITERRMEKKAYWRTVSNVRKIFFAIWRRSTET